MPAQLVDELDESGQLPQHTGALDSAVSEQPAAQSAEEALLGDDVPDKYRGKTARELLDIVVNQDSHIGRQGQELGTLRNEVGTLQGLVQQSLDMRDGGRERREEVGVEEDLDDNAFIINPRDAVSKTVERKTKAQEDRLARLEQQAAAIDFGRRHPTAETDLEDPNFVQFVQKSRVRQGLASRAFADRDNIDFEAAEELWGLWEDYQSMLPSEQATANNETASQSDTEAASQEPTKEAPQMVTAGSSGEVGGTHKPTYSQAALNRLQAENPDLYWAQDTQAKINEARAEGRVLQDI